jgi:hypothetical protein
VERADAAVGRGCHSQVAHLERRPRVARLEGLGGKPRDAQQAECIRQPLEF